MENGDKISVGTRDGKNLPAVKGKDDVELRGMLDMLHHLIQDFQEKRPYNLEEEFIKTKKNRNNSVIFVVLLSLVVFGLSLYAVTFYLSQRSRGESLAIGTFEDLRLKDLLSEASRNQVEMERAVQELSSYEAMITDELNSIERNTALRIDEINSSELSAFEKNRQIRQIQAESDKKSTAIHAIYGPKIEAKKLQIAGIQQRMDAYDARLVEQARKQEQQLDSQRMLFDLEKKQIVTSYDQRLSDQKKKYEKDLDTLKKNYERTIAALIKKYNPDLSKTSAGRYLAEAAPAVSALKLSPYRRLLGTEKILEESEMAFLQEDSTALTAILSAMSDIPYETSIRNAVAALQGRGSRMINGYDSLWSSLAGLVESKNARIAEQAALLSQYVYALEVQTSTSRENGYIIDPRNEQNMLVYMDPRRPVPDGASGYIFRSDDEYIGTVTFKVKDGKIRAVLTALVAPDIQPAPFDKLLLKIE